MQPDRVGGSHPTGLPTSFPMPRILIQLNVNGVVRQIFISHLLRTSSSHEEQISEPKDSVISLLIRLKYVYSVQVFVKWSIAISRIDNIVRASVSLTLLRCGETSRVVMGLTDRKRPKMVKLSAHRRMAVASMSRPLRAYSVSLSV